MSTTTERRALGRCALALRCARPALGRRRCAKRRVRLRHDAVARPSSARFFSPLPDGRGLPQGSGSVLEGQVGLPAAVRVVPRREPAGRHRRPADRRPRHARQRRSDEGAGEDGRELLAVRDDALRLHQARDAADRARQPHRRPGLCADRVHPVAGEDRVRRRDHERRDARRRSRCRTATASSPISGPSDFPPVARTPHQSLAIAPAAK